MALSCEVGVEIANQNTPKYNSRFTFSPGLTLLRYSTIGPNVSKIKVGSVNRLTGRTDLDGKRGLHLCNNGVTYVIASPWVSRYEIYINRRQFSQAIYSAKLSELLMWIGPLNFCLPVRQSNHWVTRTQTVNESYIYALNARNLGEHLCSSRVKPFPLRKILSPR